MTVTAFPPVEQSDRGHMALHRRKSERSPSPDFEALMRDADRPDNRVASESDSDGEDRVLPPVKDQAQEECRASLTLPAELGFMQFLVGNRTTERGPVGEGDLLRGQRMSHHSASGVRLPDMDGQQNDGNPILLSRLDKGLPVDRHVLASGRHPASSPDSETGKEEMAAFPQYSGEHPAGGDVRSMDVPVDAQPHRMELAPPPPLAVPPGAPQVQASPARQILDRLEQNLMSVIQADTPTTAPVKLDQLRLVLTPQSLGEVHIVLRRRGKELSVTILTSETSSAALLRPDLGYLRDQLSALAPQDGSQRVTITLQPMEPSADQIGAGTSHDPGPHMASTGGGSGRGSSPSSSGKEETSLVMPHEEPRDDSRSPLERRPPGLLVV